MASITAKIEYRPSVYKSLKKELKADILKSVKSSPELRNEIRKTFQQANRRIQNIESKNLISPAVTALNKGDVKGFTKFSMKNDWNTLKLEYAKAVNFLRQPTSTATGTRDYNKHLMKTYDLTQDEFDLMAQKLNDKLTSVSDSDFVERYLMRYKDFTGELEQTAKDISSQIESEAEQLANAIDSDLDRQADNVSQQATDYIQNTINEILDSFNDFGI